MQQSLNNGIPRPRAEKLLRDALEATPVTLLCAPMGSGKSTLIGTVVAQRDDVVVFSVQPWHREQFIDEFLEAIRSRRPDFGRRTVAAREAQASPPRLASAFVADLTHTNQPLVLVLDNVERAPGRNAFVAFVDALAQGLPPHVRLLVSGRVVPEISVGTLTVARRVTIVSQDALSFSEEELAEALRLQRLPASAGDIERLYHETHGWPAAVSIALTMGETGPVSTRELAISYLGEALLEKLDPIALDLLERSALADRIEDSTRETLSQAGIPVAREQGILRLHPLVRSAVIDRMQRHGTLHAAHAAAATDFARRGNLNAALFHALESSDEATADAILRSHGAALVRTGDHVSLRRLLELLKHPRSEDVRAYVYALLEKSAGGEHVDDYLERAAASTDPAIAFGARSERIERSIARLGAIAPDALEDVMRRATDLGPGAQAQATLFSAWASAVSLDFPAALEALRDVRAIDDAATRFNSGILYAYASAARGDVDEALGELDRLVAMFEHDDRVVYQTLTLVWQARIALLFGFTTVASDAARAALSLVETLSVRAEEAALYAALTEVATHEGKIDEIISFAERLRTRAPHAWYAADVPRAKAFAEIALARAAFLGHDNATARDLAMRVAKNENFPSAARALAWAEAAAYGVLAGSTLGADEVHRSLAYASSVKPVDAADAVSVRTALDMLSFVASSTSEETAPVSSGYLAPFDGLLEAREGLVTFSHAAIALKNLRAGTATREPFRAAIDRLSRHGPRFEARLLRAFAPKDEQHEGAQPAAAIDLTARELEILSLLVEGLSNKEMAERLIVSPRTVETHVERVLGKLEVGSRSRAIAKALRLRLVTLPA